MATVSEVTQALMDVLTAALPEIDASDLNSYLPAATTRSVALIGVPTGNVSTLQFTALGTGYEAAHRIRLQLWVSFNETDAECLERARDIGYRAMSALIAADGTGYELDVDGPDAPLSSEVGAEVLSVAEIPYLLVTVTANVWHAH